MIASRVTRALLAFGAAMVILPSALALWVSGRVTPPDHRLSIVSTWRDGELVARFVSAEKEADREFASQLSAPNAPRGIRVDEVVIEEGPLVAWPDVVLAMGLVPSVDGVRVRMGEKVAVVTPDDLLVRQAYDKWLSIPSLMLSTGTDVEVIWALAAERLGVAAPELRAHATLDRIRVRREVGGGEHHRALSTGADDLDASTVRRATFEAAQYLARGVNAVGEFRYMVDAPTNSTLNGYDWPRHAGATYFLAQAAGLFHDETLIQATLRAGNLLRTKALVNCGTTSCIGGGDSVDVGSTALAVVAFVEIVRNQLDATFLAQIPPMTAFLLQQQRADGELMHIYDRATGKPRDVQLPYYTGEAALALSRANLITGNPAELKGAASALAYLVGPAWRFFGDRYFYAEEHWTCQVLGDTWSRAPNPEAFDFCLRWSRFNRILTLHDGDAPYDVDGAFGISQLITPRLTPVGSRSEAAASTLEVARLSGPKFKSDVGAIEDQLRRALALLIRYQLSPGPSHLLHDPAAVAGALPGSAVDWQLRIDYVQHAGSAFVKWLELHPEPSSAKNAKR